MEMLIVFYMQEKCILCYILYSVDYILYITYCIKLLQLENSNTKLFQIVFLLFVQVLVNFVIKLL